ncbi:MAG: SIMPL domain-containing protein [Anaerolineae bacterium]|jgi:uncharacterized protein YggE
MKTRNTINTILLAIVAGLLLLNGSGTKPDVVTVGAADADAAGSITVSGSSAIRVQPDRVVVVLGVETFARTPSASRDENARRSKAVLDAIRTQGIADKDIATADLTLQPRYDDYERNIVSGYGARNTIAVTLRDVEKLEPVLVATLEAGATSVDGVEFSVTNLRELRDRARDLAVKAALEKAAAMAESAGVGVGNVTGIHEDSWYSGYFGSWGSGRNQWTNVQNVVQDLAAEGALTLEDGSISLGQIVVKAQVTLTAEIVSK